MPQMQFPLFPEDVTHITSELAFKKQDHTIIYFNGSMPVFSHAENDIKSFRMITSQFCVNGNAKQADIARAFGITKIIVKRSVKLYREKGIQGFYAQRNVRGATVLTEDVLSKVQSELNENIPLATIANQHSIKLNTLQKAIKAGRLYQAEKKTSAQP